MKGKAVLGLLIVGLIFFLCFGCVTDARAQVESKPQQNGVSPTLPEPVNVTIVVEISDVNTVQDTANLNFFLTIYSYPENVSSLKVVIAGGGQAFITCNNTLGSNQGAWFFQGESDNNVWVLQGDGQNFPYDTYSLTFYIQQVITAFPVNCSLTNEYSEAYFYGSNYLSLDNLWTRNDNTIPLSWQSVTFPDNATTLEMNINLTKTSNALDDEILELLVPIMACYFLLATTLMLDPEKHLNERLTIYLALFVFVPTFLIAIQTYLPYRSSLSFPELLLTNLVISTTIFGVFSIIGKQKNWRCVENGRLKIHHNYWDLIAVGLSLMFLLITYYSTLFGKIAPQASFIFSYCIIPAYVIWFPFENIKITESTSLKRNKTFKAFIIATPAITICFLVSWFFSGYILGIIPIVAGLFIGLYLGKSKKERSSLLSFVSIVVSAIIAGVLVSILPFHSILGTGLSAVYNGIVVWGLYGYPIGILTAMFGYVGGVLSIFLASDEDRHEVSTAKPQSCGYDA